MTDSEITELVAQIVPKLSSSMVRVLRNAQRAVTFWYVDTNTRPTLMGLHRRDIAHWLGYPEKESPEPGCNLVKLTRLGVAVRSFLLDHPEVTGAKSYGSRHDR